MEMRNTWQSNSSTQIWSFPPPQKRCGRDRRMDCQAIHAHAQQLIRASHIPPRDRARTVVFTMNLNLGNRPLSRANFWICYPYLGESTKTDPCLGRFASKRDPSERHVGTMVECPPPPPLSSPHQIYSFGNERASWPHALALYQRQLNSALNGCC